VKVKLTKRRLFLVVAGLLVIAIVASLFSTVRGWMAGEPFYRGRPASYWSRELGTWFPVSLRGGFVCSFGNENEGERAEKRSEPPMRVYVRLPGKWQLRVLDYAPPRLQRFLLEQPPILHGDPKALPVLMVLLDDENIEVRKMAIHGLKALGPEAAEAVPALRKRLEDEDAEVRKQAEAALRGIEAHTETTPE
jgi:hypothetical protein